MIDGTTVESLHEAEQRETAGAGPVEWTEHALKNVALRLGALFLASVVASWDLARARRLAPGEFGRRYHRPQRGYEYWQGRWGCYVLKRNPGAVRAKVITFYPPNGLRARRHNV